MPRRPLILLIAAAACVPAASPPAVPTPGAPTAAEWAALGREVHWVRSAAEYRALTIQTFRTAGDRLRELESRLEDGTWAVIMDADETLLDNSEFEKRLVETGAAFEESAWDAWVLEESAAAVPGAAEFVSLVQSLGGRVAVVTNRHAGICDATRRNLAALGMRVAVVLCETDSSQKEARFRLVAEGAAAEGVPPLRAVMWIGDNIGDFPDLEPSLRDAPSSAYAEFGRRYFVIPNPMYGSWLGNPWR